MLDTRYLIIIYYIEYSTHTTYVIIDKPSFNLFNKQSYHQF